jgi:lauroyl/myristoyl acyltransferase
LEFTATSVSSPGLSPVFSLKRLLGYLDYRLLLPLAARLSVSSAYRLAEARGDLLYCARRASREHAVANLQGALAVSEPEARTSIRRQFRTASVDELEAFWFDDHPSFFERHVEVRGAADLQAAAGKPGGILLVMGHWGSACTLFVALGRMGIHFHIVGRPLERDLDPIHPAHLAYGRRRIAAIERAAGHPLIYTGRGNFTRLGELLRSGETVLMMFDVTPNILRHVQPVRFFGRTAYFADGVVKLQEQSGARVFLGGITRDEEKPLQRVSLTELNPAAAEGGLLQGLVGLLEEEIRRRPHEWLLWDSMTWFYQPKVPGTGGR